MTCCCARLTNVTLWMAGLQLNLHHTITLFCRGLGLCRDAQLLTEQNPIKRYLRVTLVSCNVNKYKSKKVACLTLRRFSHKLVINLAKRVPEKPVYVSSMFDVGIFVII